MEFGEPVEQGLLLDVEADRSSRLSLDSEGELSEESVDVLLFLDPNSDFKNFEFLYRAITKIPRGI